MNPTVLMLALCLGLFLGMLAIYSACYRAGRRRLLKESTIPEPSGAIIGAVFGLLGLLITFTYFEAQGRFNTRRQLMVQEANAMGTAYLRLELLPAPAQPPLRAKFREYAAARASLFAKLEQPATTKAELDQDAALLREIWTQAVTASSGPEQQVTRALLLPALNEMSDIVTTRTMAIRTHPPWPVFAVLFAIALVCAAMTGYRASTSEYSGRFYNILLAAVMACVLFLILDIEYPRFGLIRLDTANQALVELAATMK
jgi:hypothetical protein